MSSEKIETPNVPQAPILYGIDPSVTYKWVPVKFREEFFLSAFEEFWKQRGLEAMEDGERSILIEKEFRERFRGRRVAPKTAPWVEVGPMSSEVGLRLETASSYYQQNLRLAKEEKARQVDAVKAKKLSKAKEAAAIKAIEAEHIAANVTRGTSAYPPELIHDVLSDVVRGWGGFVKPFTTWEECAAVLPAADKYELFWDVVSNNAFTQTEFESFEFAPVSQQA